MNIFYCPCCRRKRKFKKVKNEHMFEGDGLLRGLMCVMTYGISEAFGTITKYYECSECGYIKEVWQ